MLARDLKCSHAEPTLTTESDAGESGRPLSGHLQWLNTAPRLPPSPPTTLDFLWFNVELKFYSGQQAITKLVRLLARSDPFQGLASSY